MHEIFNYTYSLSVCPNKLSVYKKYNESRGHKITSLNAKENVIKKNYNVELSISSKKQIIACINWIIAQAKKKRYFSEKTNKYYFFRVNFITLTLPSTQIHCDNTIKSVALNQFITELKKKNKEVKYFWRAEKQSNGNIHFHLVTDMYIHYEKLRNMWNRCINKLGYVDRFELAHKHNNPNSTDVHAIKNIRNLGAYLSKYVSKNMNNQSICGRLWSCDIMTSKYKKLVLDEGEFSHDTIYSLKKNNEVKEFIGDYYHVFYGKIHTHLLNEKSLTSDNYKEHLKDYSNSKLKKS